MANTPNFALYKPNRADTSVEVDTSLADNFTKIDTELQNNKGGLTAHINDANAHTSENITHSDGNVKTTLDNHEERIGQTTDNINTVVLPIIGDLGTRMSDAEGTINKHIGDISDLETRVDDIETLGLDKLAPNLEGRISTIESDVEGILAPATFDAMDQQSYTFDEYRIGYVDNKVGEVDLIQVPGATSVVGGINKLNEQLADIAKQSLKWYVVTQPPYNANVGSADNKTAIQQAIDDCSANGGGIVYIPVFLNTDTIVLKDNVTLMGDGANTGLKQIAHTTSHNPLVRIGDAVAGVSNANVTNMKLDGNKDAQTFASEEWSPAVFIWGSNNNSVSKCVITNTQGDGITIGYDSARVVGSNANIIRENEIYNVKSIRMCISITYGNENNILYNKCSGVIDLELNASTGECKNNLVHGNKGRIGTENLTSPRISDLWISLASLNIDKRRYSGNIVTDNHCYMISGQYNKETIIKGNLVVGSNATQTWLLSLDAFDNSIVSDNILIANLTVATALTEIIRTRAGQNLLVTDNLVENETIRFRNYVAGFGAEPNAANHIFKNNNLTGTGNYNNGGTEKIGEETLFKLEVVAGVKTLTRIGGVPCNVTVGNSGTNLLISVGGGSGVSYLIEFSPYCSNTVGTGATALDKHLVHKYTVSGSTRIIEAYTSTITAGALSLAVFDWTTGTGTFFFKITF